MRDGIDLAGVAPHAPRVVHRHPDCDECLPDSLERFLISVGYLERIDVVGPDSI